MKSRGFTFLELLITLAVIGTIVFLAVPAMTRQVLFVRANISTDELYRSLKYARSEAIVRRKTIGLCASYDGESCSPEGYWEQGWIVYIDESGESDKTTAVPVIRRHSATKSLTIRKNVTPLHIVKFNQDGTIDGNGNGSFCFCDKNTNRSMSRLVFIHSGRLRIKDYNPYDKNESFDCAKPSAGSPQSLQCPPIDQDPDPDDS